MVPFSGQKERRSSCRLFVDLPFEYRVLDTPHAHGGLVVNASEAGLLIQSLKNMPIGTKLNIEVLFPKEFELSNFEVVAQVIWKDLHWAEGWEGFRYGLKFIEIMENDLQKLKQLLSERSPSEKVPHNP